MYRSASMGSMMVGKSYIFGSISSSIFMCLAAEMSHLWVGGVGFIVEVMVGYGIKGFGQEG